MINAVPELLPPIVDEIQIKTKMSILPTMYDSIDQVYEIFKRHSMVHNINKGTVVDADKGTPKRDIHRSPYKDTTYIPSTPMNRSLQLDSNTNISSGPIPSAVITSPDTDDTKFIHQHSMDIATTLEEE
uniref:Uncharacterized protein n=1 Tax=Lygus hesperus TaxID=30085 RepID=A0A0A9YUB6_LYGHE